MKLRLIALLFVCSSVAAEIRWEPFPLRDAPAGLTAQLGRLTVPLVRARPVLVRSARSSRVLNRTSCLLLHIMTTSV